MDDFDEEMERADMADSYDNGGRSYQVLLKYRGVKRTCCYCKTVFVGMPDHGVCPRCADKLEQGYDLEVY
jgi:hypothetical protein